MVEPPEHPQLAAVPTVLGNPNINLPDLNLPSGRAGRQGKQRFNGETAAAIALETER